MSVARATSGVLSTDGPGDPLAREVDAEVLLRRTPEALVERVVLGAQLRHEVVALAVEQHARGADERRKPPEAIARDAHERAAAHVVEVEVVEGAEGLDRLREHRQDRARAVAAERRLDARLVAEELLDVHARDDGRAVRRAHDLDEDAAPLLGRELLAQDGRDVGEDLAPHRADFNLVHGARPLRRRSRE